MKKKPKNLKLLVTHQTRLNGKRVLRGSYLDVPYDQGAELYHANKCVLVEDNEAAIKQAKAQGKAMQKADRDAEAAAAAQKQSPREKSLEAENAELK